jgi:multicomponent K+:H+ antiporter subunit D
VPVVLPLLAGAALLALERLRPAWQAPLSIATTLGLLLVALQLALDTADGTVHAYLVGNWPAPFGIALAADRLSTLMLLLTAVVALGSLLAALADWHARGAHFHALFQFQLMGLSGAFLTADLFNLFVFFEVLLAASYGLLLHGGGGERLRAATHYVALNLTGSALFLIAVSLLYALTGTLNLADLAMKVPLLEAGDAPLARVAALLLLVVFCLKAALFPLGLWLPATYGAAAAPVAALFAIMTKVGIYAVIRVFTTVFGEQAGALAGVGSALLTPLGLTTLVLAALGALASPSLCTLCGWLVVGSAGTLLAAVGLSQGPGLAAALYYLAHSTLIAAALFLLVELIARQRGSFGASLDPGPRIAQPALLGAMFFVCAASVAGLPPLSGFLGKVSILVAALPSQNAWAFWGIVLATSLLTLIALARAGSRLFWKTREELVPASPHVTLAVAAPSVLLAGTIALAVFAAPAHRYTADTAAQLVRPDEYIRSVLGAKPSARSGVLR